VTDFHSVSALKQSMWVERAERWERGETKWFRTTEKAEASNEAGRQLLAFRAFCDWMIWKKWEVLDFHADADTPEGNAGQPHCHGSRLDLLPASSLS